MGNLYLLPSTLENEHIVFKMKKLAPMQSTILIEYFS